MPSNTTEPPSCPAPGPHIDDPVGVRHHGLVVLDRDDRDARVDEAVEHREHAIDVGEVQTGRRLVQHVDGRPLRHLHRELQPLALAAREGVEGLAERHIAPTSTRRCRIFAAAGTFDSPAEKNSSASVAGISNTSAIDFSPSV